MEPSSISSLAQTTTAAGADRQELREAAQAFEAIFLRQMLASARASTLLDEDSPFSGAGMTEFAAMRDDHFADLAARGGGLGLADQIETQLAAVLTQREA